jgi:hypothetical protein
VQQHTSVSPTEVELCKTRSFPTKRYGPNGPALYVALMDATKLTHYAKGEFFGPHTSVNALPRGGMRLSMPMRLFMPYPVCAILPRSGCSAPPRAAATTVNRHVRQMHTLICTCFVQYNMRIDTRNKAASCIHALSSVSACDHLTAPGLATSDRHALFSRRAPLIDTRPSLSRRISCLGDHRGSS